jgi:hypothetical protein
VESAVLLFGLVVIYLTASALYHPR